MNVSSYKTDYYDLSVVKNNELLCKDNTFFLHSQIFLTKSHKFFHFPYILPPAILFTSSPLAFRLYSSHSERSTIYMPPRSTYHSSLIVHT